MSLSQGGSFARDACSTWEGGILARLRQPREARP
jgi:hypothetical protein